MFLDDEDYTPYMLDADVVGDAAGYIIDGLDGCYVQIIDDMPVALQLPQSVTIEVVETPPELKGGTATKRPKPASCPPASRSRCRSTSAPARRCGSTRRRANSAAARTRRSRRAMVQRTIAAAVKDDAYRGACVPPV